MPIATFAPNPRPSPGADISNKVSLRSAELGDGYVATQPKGLNHIAKQVTLRWDALTLDQALAFETFFEAQGGYKPFWFTLRSEATRRKWTCREWSRVDGAPSTFKATLIEDFSNVT